MKMKAKKIKNLRRRIPLKLCLSVTLLILLGNISDGATKEVHNVTELQSSIENSSEGDEIVIANDFTYGDLIIKMPTSSVTIDGNNNVWNKGSITIEGGSNAKLTIKNLNIDGSSINKELITNYAAKGRLVLDNVKLYNARFTPLNILTDGEFKTEIKNSKIYNNKANNSAPAIWLGTAAFVDINYSTIESNEGTGGGYETGAISSKHYEAELNINNSVFRKNKNSSVNTGIFGGGGGAMAMHYFKGIINISESIFDQNQTSGEGTEVNSTYDGGAIYIFDGRDGAVFNIDRSTFSNNLAYDDGGAILLQGTGNPGLTTSITNSTFFNNKAYGLDGAGYSGGAIQYFKNGGSSKMTNNILSSTFVGNQSGNESTTAEQKGGAIGLSGAGLFATATVTRNDSLFIGNQVYGADGKINEVSNYKDLSNYATAQAGTTNVINVDKGETPAYTLKDVLGIKNVMLSKNLSEVQAGVDKEYVKTIPIKPEGIADNTYSGTTTIPNIDQRNHSRYKDQGAVEIS
ncbi:hypothetical protein [Peptostreptococcus faecalis]|uniref:hypothetical protein n=1 Tax=Peptostreptococcus faecalis TaxID=2045015 RepID=UPI000C7DB759|nr:hypothetical protein [Peptostreptococcus faecalis]